MVQGEGHGGAAIGDGPLHALVDSIAEYAIFMLDPDGRVVSWNRGAAKLKGYDASQIIGQHFSLFYPEEDRAAGVPKRVLETARSEGKFEGEGWRVRKDGSRFWALVVIDQIRDAEGTLVGFSKVTRDLTERKLAEEALRRSEEQFRLLVQSVIDYAIFMLDPEGVVASWNQGAGRIKGYRPEEIIGQHFSRFYTPEDREKGEPQRALDTALKQGRYESEGWRLRRNGTRFWANVVIDPIRDEDGALRGFAKVTRDITETREARFELDQAREALFQSQKTEAIGRLTGGVAHDFNNLLMAVQGSLELLRKRVPDDPKIRSLIDSALQGAQRGSALTQRMLAFARRQTLRPTLVDVTALVRGMADLLQRSLGPLVTIETRFPLTIDAINVDANQLELALLNLTLNARDAMPAGGHLVIAARAAAIDATKHPDLPIGRYVCLSVIDRGEGMDAETLSRAAEPFFTTKGLGKGTGLGLSMVQGIASQSGGRLVLDSRKGEGTTAELWFPVAGTAAAGQDLDWKEPERPAENGVQPLVVLTVDDDALVLQNTVFMLEDLGHRSLPAASGEEALGILNKESLVDLIITDHAMPNMTGTELARRIRSDRPDVPIVLATGYAELRPEDDRDLPRLAKPFRQRELAAIIAATMKAARSRAELAS